FPRRPRRSRHGEDAFRQRRRSLPEELRRALLLGARTGTAQMKRRLLLCAVVAALLPAAAKAADDTAACQLLRVTSVDMSVSIASHITVPITVGGQDLTIAIDTGAISTMINQSVVDQLGLHPEMLPINVRITVFGGRRIDHMVTAHDIVFGGLKAHEMP